MPISVALKWDKVAVVSDPDADLVALRSAPNFLKKTGKIFLEQVDLSSVHKVLDVTHDAGAWVITTVSPLCCAVCCKTLAVWTSKERPM